MMKSKATMTIKIICTMLCLAALAACAAGCTKEDFSKCEGAKFHFRYTRHIYGGDRVADEINRFTVHVFDSGKRFVGKYSDHVRQPDGSFIVLADGIKPGTYSFVAWGNLCEHFDFTPFIAGTTLMDQARLTFKNPTTDVGHCLGDGLFHGLARDVEIRSTADGMARVHFDMTKNTNAVKVIITLPGATPGFSCSITSDNTTYKFDNSIVGSGQRLYIPKVRQEGGKIISDFIILRELNDGATLSRLVITRHHADGTEERLYDVALTPLLLAIAKTGNLDTDDTYTLNIKLEYTGSTVTMTINEWTVNNSGVILG